MTHIPHLRCIDMSYKQKLHVMYVGKCIQQSMIYDFVCNNASIDNNAVYNLQVMSDFTFAFGKNHY